MRMVLLIATLVLTSCTSSVEVDVAGGTSQTGTSGSTGACGAGAAVNTGGGGACSSGGSTGTTGGGPGTGMGGTAGGGDSGSGGNAGGASTGGGTGTGGEGGGSCDAEPIFPVCFEPCGCDASVEEMNAKCKADVEILGHAVLCTSPPDPGPETSFKECKKLVEQVSCSGNEYAWYCCEP